MENNIEEKARKYALQENTAMTMFTASLCGFEIGYTTCLEDVVKVIEEEIIRFNKLLQDNRLSSEFDHFYYSITVLTDLLTKLKTQPK